MKQKIADNLHDPEALERIYRENKRDFTREFSAQFSGNENELVRFWKIRLAHEPVSLRKTEAPDFGSMMILFLLVFLFALIPEIFASVQKEFFYTRDMAAVVFSGLIAYTSLRNRLPVKRVFIFFTLVFALLLYINLLPGKETDSLVVAFIHVPLFLWCLFGAAYISFDFGNTAGKMDFIRYTGELLTMTGLLMISGGILTAITIGLFSVIGMNIEKTYFEYIALPGAAGSPVVASYLISLYPDITRRIVPVIARVFTPVALLTLVIYLVFLAISGINLLENRDILILFNVVLVAVTAIIIFSITELDKTKRRNFHVMILLILAMVTLVINSIALTVIITRLTYGLTPNRVVVFITNILVFINLILIAKDLFRSWSDAEKLHAVEITVAKYLVVYFLWTVAAIFLLPPVFGFR